MNVTVAGLWHLGSVVAAGLAVLGCRVTGYDPDERVVKGLNEGFAPIAEPELDEAIQQHLAAGCLTFSTDLATSLRNADVCWVAFDTPVRDDDSADTEYVEQQITAIMDQAPAKMLFLISSQLPVGTIGRLERQAAECYSDRHLRFACTPENLRLGQALPYFLHPDRMVVGVRDAESRKILKPLLDLISAPIEWMSVESAEMAKHAINSFLALSVSFANELAVLCERTGADAREVERALKSEQRIGPKAYVRAGSAFAGGTLARDVHYLSILGEGMRTPLQLIPAIHASNEAHKRWVYHTLEAIVAEVAEPWHLAILGLTYKPGTDTLRRSTAVEIAEWAADRGAHVTAYDPAVKCLPEPLASKVALCPDIAAACHQATVVFIGTPWREFRDIAMADMMHWAPKAVIIDPDRFLVDQWSEPCGLDYRAVGVKPSRTQEPHV